MHPTLEIAREASDGIEAARQALDAEARRAAAVDDHVTAGVLGALGLAVEAMHRLTVDAVLSLQAAADRPPVVIDEAMLARIMIPRIAGAARKLAWRNAWIAAGVVLMALCVGAVGGYAAGHWTERGTAAEAIAGLSPAQRAVLDAWLVEVRRVPR